MKPAWFPDDMVYKVGLTPKGSYFPFYVGIGTRAEHRGSRMGYRFYSDCPMFDKDGNPNGSEFVLEFDRPKVLEAIAHLRKRQAGQ